MVSAVWKTSVAQPVRHRDVLRGPYAVFASYAAFILRPGIKGTSIQRVSSGGYKLYEKKHWTLFGSHSSHTRDGNCNCAGLLDGASQGFGYTAGIPQARRGRRSSHEDRKPVRAGDDSSQVAHPLPGVRRDVGPVTRPLHD